MLQRLRPLLTPWRAAALALLLLAAQALGLAHRMAHGPGLPALAQASLAVGQPGSDFWGHDHPSHSHAGDAHDAHGHSHEGAAECRLYDQLLGHADLLLAAVLLPPLALPVAQQWAWTTQAASRTAAAPYQARAPPLA